MVNSADSILEDAQLLRRMARQDRQAFAQFYDRYADVLYSIVMRILHDPNEAADVLQEVFLQIWDKSHTFNAPDKPLVWAVAFARDQAVDRLRARKRQFVFIEAASETVVARARASRTTETNAVLANEKAGFMRSALATLPLEERQAIEMLVFGGMTQQEISQTLAQPPGTIRARIRRGMSTLHDTLKRPV